MKTKSLLKNTAKVLILALMTGVVGIIYAQNPPPGAINGLFSINDTLQVYFSQGNLQYQASTNTWRFAEHQWDYIGEGNANISPEYDGWIDLFGWGTSGYNHGAVCYQPWSTSGNGTDYDVYGNLYWCLFSSTGRADWGYNYINNGGDTQNTWRTLTEEEFKYVIWYRTTPSGIKYVLGNVNNVNGLIILPDDWSAEHYALTNINPGINGQPGTYTDNIITLSYWTECLEMYGAVFLPAACSRYETSVLNNSKGYYWSSTLYDIGWANHLYFDENSVDAGNENDRSNGFSVRLVYYSHDTSTTDFSVGDLNYHVNDPGVSVTVTGHVDGQSATGELTINAWATYNGTTYTVTEIGSQAFANCIDLTGELVLPSTLESIGNFAFFRCTGFTGDLVIPNLTYYVGNSAFRMCSGMTSATIGSSVSYIDESVFEFCDNLVNLYVNPDNPYFDSRDNCNAIIKTSENKLVAACNGTTIPNTVTTIGERAFGNCNTLTSIHIPSSVVAMGSSAFAYCASLADITVDPDNTVFDSRNDCNAIIETATNTLLYGGTNTVFPNDITAIGDQAFSCRYGLTGDLVIPENVVSIGTGAFYDCYNITGRLEIPASVISIGNGAFSSCRGFSAAVVLADVPPTLGDNEVFLDFGCHTLTVPCGCIPAYQNSDWSNFFTTIIEDCGGVAEIDDSFASVYPNPTSGIVNIKAEGIQNISVYNVLGEKVFETPASCDSFEYDLSNHGNGVYLVRIEMALGVLTKRVMVE